MNCGRNGTYQVIHLDRIKPAKAQTLRGKEEGHLLQDNYQSNEVDLQPEPLPEEKEEEDNLEQGSYRRYGRQRQRPAWAKDYVLSIYRSAMVNTKTTERKHQWCNTCRKMVPSDTFVSHQILCARKRKACEECSATFSRLSYLTRHKRTFHVYKPEFIKPVKTVKMIKKVSSPLRLDVDDTWDKDPDIMLGDDIKRMNCWKDVLSGRMYVQLQSLLQRNAELKQYHMLPKILRKKQRMNLWKQTKIQVL